jgi:hypothetical protein
MHESQLRHGRSGEPGLGRRAENEARAEVERVGQASRAQALLDCVKRKEGGKEREVGRTRFLYTTRKQRRAHARALPNAAVTVS